MDPRVQNLIAFLGENLDRKITLEKMALHVRLSRWRLSHLFKAQIGLSPEQYLMSLRLRRARRLLETTFLSVKEVRNSVGINDKGHFVRCFKRAYGLTPTECRAASFLLRTDEKLEGSRQQD